MRWPLVTRAKYDRQLGYGEVWREKWAAAEAENRKVRALLVQVERKLSKFERVRGTGGKFTKACADAAP